MIELLEPLASCSESDQKEEQGSSPRDKPIRGLVPAIKALCPPYTPIPHSSRLSMMDRCTTHWAPAPTPFVMTS